MNLNLNNFDQNKILDDLNTFGYSIAKGLVPINKVEALRAYGFELLKKDITDEIVWDPYVGEADKVCYSDDGFQCMYRGYAFPWNVSKSDIELNVFEGLNTLRLDLAKRLNSNYDLEITDLYTTWSYYPSGKGWLKSHKDSVYSDSLLLHYIIPLTFKGIDYEDGGLFFTDKLGVVVDVDAELKKGDVLFFDGSCTHEVRKVLSKSNIGRMQAFAIPVEFLLPEQSERFLKKIPMLKIVRIKAKVLISKIKRCCYSLLGTK